MDLPTILFLLAVVLQWPKKSLGLYSTRSNCRVYNSQPIVPILSQLNPIHNLPTEFFKIYYIIFPSTPRSSRRSVSLRYPHQNLISTHLHIHTCYMPYSSHSSWIDHWNNIWWRLHITKLIIMPPSPVSSYLVPLTVKYLHRLILKYSYPMFFSQCERPSFTPI